MIADFDIPDLWEELSDVYVTDGRRLWRIVSLPGRARGLRAAVLEDCRTLELRTCHARRLRRLRRLAAPNPSDRVAA